MFTEKGHLVNSSATAYTISDLGAEKTCSAICFLFSFQREEVLYDPIQPSWFIWTLFRWDVQVPVHTWRTRGKVWSCTEYANSNRHKQMSWHVDQIIQYCLPPYFRCKPNALLIIIICSSPFPCGSGWCTTHINYLFLVKSRNAWNISPLPSHCKTACILCRNHD